MSLNITISLKEIYDLLCDDCKRKLRDYIKSKVAEAVTKQLLLEVGRDVKS